MAAEKRQQSITRGLEHFFLEADSSLGIITGSLRVLDTESIRFSFFIPAKRRIDRIENLKVLIEAQKNSHREY